MNKKQFDKVISLCKLCKKGKVKDLDVQVHISANNDICGVDAVDNNFDVKFISIDSGDITDTIQVETSKLEKVSKIKSDYIRVAGVNTGNKTVKFELGNTDIALATQCYTLPLHGNYEVPNLVAEITDTIKFRDSLKSLMRFTSKDDIRPIFTGVMLHNDKSRIENNTTLTMVAVDGFRVLKINFECSYLENNIDKFYDCVLPADTLNFIIKCIDNNTNSIIIECQDDYRNSRESYNKRIKITIYNKDMRIVITSKMIEGDFLRYQTVFSDTEEVTFTVDSSILYDELKEISSICKNDKKEPTKLSIVGDLLTLSSCDSDIKINKNIQVKSSGNIKCIAFNPNYVRDAMQVFKDFKIDNVTTQYISEYTPLIFNNEDKSIRALVLPVRINA